MATTLPELKERIKDRLDEVTILEVLDISAEDLVEAFADRIEERQDALTQELFDDNNRL